MLRRVALVRSDVSEECRAPIIRVTRIGELGTMLAVTSNRRTLRKNTMLLLVTANIVPSSPILCHPDDGGVTFIRKVGSYESHTANIPEDCILHSHRHEHLKSYKIPF
jgi:hypothetical protein